jgi:hypothetical protein
MEFQVREEFFPECEALYALLGKSVCSSEKPHFALIHCDKVLLQSQISNRISPRISDSTT